SSLDAVLTLFDLDGVTVIAINDDENNATLDSKIEVQLPASGRYFLSVADTDDGGGADFFYRLSLKVSSTTTQVTHNTGNVRMTLIDNGIYGDDGRNTGAGFSFMGSPGGTLFSGGFIAATPTKVAANVPSLVDNQTQQPIFIDFEEALPFTPFSSDANFNQIATCQFDEGTSNAANSPIGIAVMQNSYSNSNDRFVLVECEVTNNTSTTITDLYLGQFGDWDVGLSNFNRNRGGYDAMRNLVYQFEFGSNPNDGNYYGMKALQTATGARVTNFLSSTTASIEDSLFAFLSNLNGPGPKTITSNMEYRSFIGSGPFTLGPGASVTVGFAWVGGTDLSDLQANADVAQTAWDNLIVSVDETPSSIVPKQFVLEQNYPNPFNPSTTIKFDLSADSKVTLNIYNIKGQLVRQLLQEKLSAGSHSFTWDAKDDHAQQLPSGLYVSRLQAGDFVQHRKMLLIK
ncbi:T9SS type A sorting domain-containing protein, partial [candidate division KSB1 bacterium]|nr:T9SS type A sorting domain-containing protein [candidate division KSB1 bacterium]